MSDCDEIRDTILGRLKVSVLIIIIIIIVIINNFASCEQGVSCGRLTAKSMTRTITRIKQRISVSCN